MSEVRVHAPYVCLVKVDAAAELYDLYVTIPHYATDQVSGGNLIEYGNGTTLIRFDVINHHSAVGFFTGDYHQVRIPLAPNRPEYTFNPAAFSIRVDCTHHSSGTATSRVYYTDADVNPNLGTGKLALNYPYLYLTNPNTVLGAPLNDFKPYCLFFLDNGFVANGFQQGSDALGSFTQEIVLSKSASAPTPAGATPPLSGPVGLPMPRALAAAASPALITAIAPANIAANIASYQDNGPIDGNFDVFVTATTLSRRRRGRLRNADADENPNSFIDMLSFRDDQAA